ncbi:hypothetical protein Pve01_52900 [Planomonospora venezuelensis]|uniref:Uncharacterized protein n=1 Tax=Planomonospora venezuelensis TaxID=1999 RepID=A0A841DD76_PLAVE|nr:hypothetical protein [Planomonospora venezuelensis]GIN03632.1 hypothetical protein Pve01_52900 [Planomonospora venezuelensis]
MQAGYGASRPGGPGRVRMDDNDGGRAEIPGGLLPAAARESVCGLEVFPTFGISSLL